MSLKVAKGGLKGFSGDFVSGSALHLALLTVGTAFLLIAAFHGNIWFDESYSVGIAGKSFADIWAIGANDVHPVLFYEALHLINLLFGDNILAYRLFAVAGAVALAALGFTHVRRDFGWKAGVLFTFLALFTPYVALMAVEIRMYSWATFTVMVCLIYALRIAGVAQRRRSACGAQGEDAAPSGAAAGVPASWWAAFFLSSLVSAYLHYFGVLTAFVINLLLLVYLVVRRKGNGRVLAIFAAGAVVQVVAYLPWVAALLGQLGVVSNTYWANLVFPTTLIELASYPFLTSVLSFALRGSYGPAFQAASVILFVLLAAVTVAVAAYLVARIVRERRKRGERRGGGRASGGASFEGVFAASEGSGASRGLPVSWPFACAAAALVYAGVVALGWAASEIMGSLILYYRYLFVAIGPLLLVAALLLAQVRSRVLVGATCAVVLGLSVANQSLLALDDYSVENQRPLTAFEEAVEQAESVNATAADDGVLVLSSDIGFMGVTSVLLPDVAQTYLDWQPGNWGAAYRAYEPALSSVKSWDEALEGYQGRFVVIGQSADGSEPRDVTDIGQRADVTRVSSETFYRPYERTYFTIAVMDRWGAPSPSAASGASSGGP